MKSTDTCRCVVAARPVARASARTSTRPARSSTTISVARQLAAVAARPLHRLDRHLVARAGGDDDVAGDVRDADAAVASDLHLAREALGLLGAAVPALIRARGRRARAPPSCSPIRCVGRPAPRPARPRRARPAITNGSVSRMSVALLFESGDDARRPRLVAFAHFVDERHRVLQQPDLRLEILDQALLRRLVGRLRTAPPRGSR